MMNIFRKKKLLLPADEQERVIACIREAESKTTCELRIFVESRCSYVDAIDRAWELFTKLGMFQTEKRNAVLVYLAIDDHQYAIVGDEEIYKQAGGAQFWEAAATQFRQYLKAGNIGEGLCVCINELGNAMARHFPYDPTVTRNELPDEIAFGK